MSLLILLDSGSLPGISIKALDIDVLSRRLIRIVFDDEIIVNEDYTNPDNYAISVVSGTGPVEVVKVLPINTNTSLEIILVTQPMTAGTTYSVSATTLSTRTGVAFSLLGSCVSRETKTDSSLRSIPKHFDKRATSLISTLVTAIGINDDIIGGSRRDTLVATTTAV